MTLYSLMDKENQDIKSTCMNELNISTQLYIKHHL